MQNCYFIKIYWLLKIYECLSNLYILQVVYRFRFACHTLVELNDLFEKIFALNQYLLNEQQYLLPSIWNLMLNNPIHKQINFAIILLAQNIIQGKDVLLRFFLASSYFLTDITACYSALRDKLLKCNTAVLIIKTFPLTHDFSRGEFPPYLIPQPVHQFVLYKLYKERTFYLSVRICLLPAIFIFFTCHT